MNFGTRLSAGGVTVALVLLWTITPWSPAAAGPLSEGADPAASTPEQASAPALVLGGLAGGALGFVVGAGIGSVVGRKDDEDFSGLEEAYYIGSTLGAIGLAAGMEGINHDLGDGRLVALTSVGVGVAGYVALVKTEDWVVLPVTVIVQLALTAVVERATANRNLRADGSAAAHVSPGAAGSWTLAGGPAPEGFNLAVIGRF